MKMKVCTLTLSLLLTIFSYAQKDIQYINGFKYAIVATLTYTNGGKDVYGISDYIQNELSKKGIIILRIDRNTWPADAISDPCLVSYWIPQNPINNRVGITVKNCKHEIVYEKISTS